MSLKNKTIKGVAWNAVGNVASQLLRMVSLVIMVRLLTPEDYGVYAILTIFVGFFSVLANMGISQAVIYLDEPEPRMLSSIFVLNLAVSVVLYALLFLLAVPIASFFDNETIIHLLRVIGLLFVIGAFNVIQEALLTKRLDFKIVVARDLLSQFTGALIGIGMALGGLGVYSLVGAALGSSLTKTILLWSISRWRPQFWFSLSDIHAIWGYCYNLTAFSFVNYFARTADNFLIGKFLGTAALGVYSVAYNLMLYPLQNVSSVIVRVLFPALSSIKSDQSRLKSSYLKVIRYIALLTFPMMFGLLAVSNTFVEVAFGSRWQELSPLLQVLALVGLVQSIVTTVGVVYTTLGTTALMFRIGTINAGVTVLSFVVGIPFGVLGVATSYAVANLIMLYPNLHYSWQQIGLGVTEGMWALWEFFLASLVMAIGVVMVGFVQEHWELTNVWILSLQIVAGVLIYILALLLTTRLGVLQMVKEIIPTRRSINRRIEARAKASRIGKIGT